MARNNYACSALRQAQVVWWQVGGGLAWCLSATFFWAVQKLSFEGTAVISTSQDEGNCGRSGSLSHTGVTHSMKALTRTVLSRATPNTVNTRS